MTAIELNNRLSRWCQRNYFFLVLGLIILVGLGLHWAQINRLVWSSDEGIHLSAAYLVNQGKEPYSQVSFSQGPLFLELVRWPLKWSTTQGSDVTAVRLVMLSFGALLLFAVAMIARELKNELAGWIAAAILLGTPSFFYFARSDGRWPIDCTWYVGNLGRPALLTPRETALAYWQQSPVGAEPGRQISHDLCAWLDRTGDLLSHVGG
ncbi:MAG: hypothetical protein R2867_03005 [Caldilineaceae bacterium]